MKPHRFYSPLAVLLATIVATLLVSACASGTALVTGVKRAPINPSSVRLVHSLPEGAEVIARVEASSASGFTDQGSLDYAVEELKKQAAMVGANVLVITSTGSVQKGKGVTGIAVVVN